MTLRLAGGDPVKASEIERLPMRRYMQACEEYLSGIVQQHKRMERARKKQH